MGFRNFPADSLKKQFSVAEKCCTVENMKHYDCGYSWGCNVCWASYECKKCGNLYSSGAYELMKQGRTWHDVKPETKHCECKEPDASIKGMLKKSIRLRHHFCRTCHGIIPAPKRHEIVKNVAKGAPTEMPDLVNNTFK